MKKRKVEQLLKKICIEVEDDYSLLSNGCAVSEYPFTKLEISIQADFKQAFFFDGNSTLESIYFSVKDDSRAELKKFYNYANSKWLLSKDWNCDDPIISSALKTSSQSCRISFNKGRVKVTGNTLSVEKNSTMLKPGTHHHSGIRFSLFSLEEILN